MERLKQKLTVAVLALVLVGGMVLHMALPDLEISRAERRKLDQFPEQVTSDSLESYFLDQFPARDRFRTLKSIWTYYVLGQKDNNGIFLENGSASKLDADLQEKQIDFFIKKFNQLQKKHFSDSKAWCVVVPDKNYYLTNGQNYPRLDYGALFDRVEAGMPWAEHHTLTGALDAEMYYTTDSHWRQEDLQAVTAQMEGILDIDLPAWDTYRQTTLEGFHGVYYGQAALPLPADDLTYLENDVTDAAIVTSLEMEGEQKVYAPEKFSNLDGYDVYLHGPQSLLTIENPLAETDRELIIFRDSYGSSLAPLLLPAYKTVTLVDIRYLSSAFLDQFLDFHGQDVLLLYSTTLINGASILK